MIHTHTSMPDVEFFEKVGVDFEQINRCRIRQFDQFHKAEQHEQVVQFHELFAQLLLVPGKRHAIKEFAEVLPDLTPSHSAMILQFTARMIVSDLTEVPPAPEIAIIINVATKYVTTLALLSTLRHARLPTIVLDCESADGSFDWFKGLLHHHEFYLMPAKLRQHGQTLDTVFQKVWAERVLVVDSDVEVLNGEMISHMRSMLQASSRAYGSGYLHPAHWLEYHYWTDLPLAPGIGYYMERMWIPFALLRVEPVRVALGRNRSFMHRLVLNDCPWSGFLSRMLWARFRLAYFRQHPLKWLNPIRRSYNGEKPSYISYDTGADIHEFLTQEQNLQFETVTADFVPWSVTHFSGITRGSLHAGATDDAYKITAAHPIVVQRLLDGYGIDISL